MKKHNKILSMLLCVIMILSIIPTVAFATGSFMGSAGIIGTKYVGEPLTADISSLGGYGSDDALSYNWVHREGYPLIIGNGMKTYTPTMTGEYRVEVTCGSETISSPWVMVTNRVITHTVTFKANGHGGDENGNLFVAEIQDGVYLSNYLDELDSVNYRKLYPSNVFDDYNKYEVEGYYTNSECKPEHFADLYVDNILCKMGNKVNHCRR